jgi:glycosyltransferase involved in cell wall biosynthesis
LKNILYITASNPFGVSHGAQQRTHLLFQALQQLGHVHLFCITNDTTPTELNSSNFTIQFFGKNPNYKPKSRRYKLLRLYSPYAVLNEDPYLRGKVLEILDKIPFDYVVVRYVFPVFTCGLYRHKGLVIDVDDHPVQYFMTMANNRKLNLRSRFFYLIDAIHTHIFLKALFKRVQKAFFSNPTQVIPDKGVFLPNVPLLKARHDTFNNTEVKPSNKKILFVGTLQYTPNLYGIEHFITRIWPSVKSQVPDIQLDIVGLIGDSPKLSEWKTMEGINIHGFVDDLNPFYDESSVVIVPIQQGAGTHIKILEAMQYGKSIVLTKFAARGFTDLLKHMENVWIASDDTAFTKGTIRLLSDYQFNQKMGRSAANSLSDQYTVDAFHRTVFNALSNSQI